MELSYEELIARSGSFAYRTRGCSMLPMLRQGRDVVIITKKGEERLKKYDVPLYRRGDRYILHRVVAVREADYVLRGDNNDFLEYGVTDADVVGVLSAFIRDGKRIGVDDPGYRFYARFWCASYPLRMAWRRLRRAASRIKRAIVNKR